MKMKRMIPTPIASSKRQSESGVALLTVLALLSIFAVVLVGFTYTIRMEEQTIRQYADGINVQEATEASIQGVLAQVARDLDPANPHFVLGRRQPRYISSLDPWALGYGGRVSAYVTYDARSHILDNRPERILRREGLTMMPTPIPRGVDEDPAGDVTGQKQIGVQGMGDNAPGLAGIDDDLDGEIDGGFNERDDDEDFRLDEDSLDARRPDRSGQFFFPAGTGYDSDGDRLGVFDESAKININFAGNNFGPNGSQTYNLGVSATELDLPLFIYNRVVRYRNSRGANSLLSDTNAQELARAIVNFRNGSVGNGGQTIAYPGVDNQDDNGNNDPQIVTVQEYSKTSNDLTAFEAEPYAITGNDKDDDNDGLLNEEDERYIGPSTENTSSSPLNQVFDQINALRYRPGNKIDDNGDGTIDEPNEGIDDPFEFNVLKPNGDDYPYSTVDDLRLVEGMRYDKPAINPSNAGQIIPTLFEILRDSTTIYSQSDEVSAPLSGSKSEAAKINPNGSSNWRANDVWSIGQIETNRTDFQYSPMVHIEDLLSLQIDRDGDWQATAEPDVLLGKPDGQDNDGDGLVDEPSDDWDNNLYPSGDFDTAGESDLGAPAYQTGPDFDGDGDSSRDKIRSQNIVNGRLRELGWDNGTLTLDEQDTDIIAGMTVEGNGEDNDGDGLIDDDGDFNGDKQLTYDPEWHVSEDAWGDTNGDGYPGLGGNPEAQNNTLEGRIVKRPDLNDEMIVTSFADDDYDGFADFYDPQVLAAMYAPEWDGVDNDGDGEVDEIGERYIVCFDDDEDGRSDEDPPDFQLALNLIDYIDSWMPYQIADDPDIRRVLGISEDNPVLADGVTFRTLGVYSSRQRAFRMHPRFFTGPNHGSRENREFEEQMRFLLPNPPQTGMQVKFEGVESIRINEVMAKPVIRLEAEEVLSTVSFDSQNLTTVPTITPDPQRFRVLSGQDDDGKQAATQNYYDSNWGGVVSPAQGSVEPAVPHGFALLPSGFVNTINPFRPIVNLDSMAPAFIFGVTNVSVPLANQSTSVGLSEESAEWVFENIPQGYYDVVIYLHPNHQYQPEVEYTVNGQTIAFRSDIEPVSTDALQSEIVQRDTARIELGSMNREFKLHYRLTPQFVQSGNVYAKPQVSVGSNNALIVRITAKAPTGGKSHYETSFDRIELINPYAQYVELVNLSTEDVNLGGFQINTPYGHYILPKDTVIKRMKPSFKEDDDTLQPQDGIPGNGVPFEPLLTKESMNNAGSPITGNDLKLEDNKLLLAYNADGLAAFINANYPAVPNISQDRIVVPVMASSEQANIENSLPTTRNLQPGLLRNSQISDISFRLYDLQEDVLTYNPDDKYVTLYDPAGNYIDSFKYRTTFNNAIVNIPDNGNDPDLDLIALPGYRGMESFERADPTQFETKLVVNPQTGVLSGDRSVPSSIELDAKDAVVVDISTNGTYSRNAIGGYAQANESDKLVPALTRFSDEDTIPAKDSHWNGWDFIGDYYEYEKDTNDFAARDLLERTASIAREAVAPGLEKNVRFYEMLGGFENCKNVQTDNDVKYTAFIWRMGVRELIRAGYDLDVDDQLTVRVLGRKFFDENGYTGPMDMPVGEVLVIPPFKVADPGKNAIGTNPALSNNLADIFVDARRGRIPVFAKLRNGDTAFSIDLRQSFPDLYSDLSNDTGDEPTIELMIIMRKSTSDLSASNFVITPELRPDLALLGYTPWNPNAVGDYITPQGAAYAGNMSDDNYFFKGIELFGRGRQQVSDDDKNNAIRALLAGTPGRDNTGYVPAYPRRRVQLAGTQRDPLDVIDNTAYVKNGPLATLGEISRLYTGNKFETINTPIIPQRLEDRAIKMNQIMTNPMLAMRARGKQDEYRVQLAQRERLDQWENQYNQIFNMITVSDSGIRAGLINIDTAPREVLVALPFTPPMANGQLEPLQERHYFNSICADFIIEGRQPGGHDMYFGVHELNDSLAEDTVRGIKGKRMDTMSDYKLPTIGRDDPKTFKVFDDIETQRLQRLNIKANDVIGNPAKYQFLFLSSIVSEPDDGPYTDIGTLLSQLTHLKRRERYSLVLSRSWDRTFDGKKEYPGDLRERLNEELTRELTPEDMESLMNRVSSLMTVRSRAFSILTQGRVFDSDGNITAQRKLETIYVK